MSLHTIPRLSPAVRTGPRRTLPTTFAVCLLTGLIGQALAAPPGIPGQPEGTVAGNRVTLTWSPASDDEGVTGYNVYRDDRYLTTVNDTRYVAELAAGDSTRFYITAFDTPSDGSPRGYSNRSPEAEFGPGTSATASDDSAADVPGDTRPPAVSDLVSPSTSTDGVLLVWSAPRSSIVGYNVYRDGAYLTTVNGVGAYLDEAVPAGTRSVTYSVVAFDEVPRFSPYSDSITVELTGTPDEPPMDDDPGTGTPEEPDTVAPAEPDTTTEPDPVTPAEPDTDTPAEPDPVTPAEPDTDTPAEPDPVTPAEPDTGTPAEPDPVTPAEPDTGAPDIEIGQYNRTATEALSVRVNGPGRTDRDRTVSEPSAPTGLVALLTADNWVELDWVPSVDDGAVVAYEIYRDGLLVATIDDKANPPRTEPRVEELRSLRTTTYIDCNYTKDINCQTVGQPQPGVAHSYQVVAIDDTGLKSAFSAPLTVELNTIRGSAAPDPVSEGYTLAFGDDFDGNSIDSSNWLFKMPWGQDVTVNGETQYFVNASENEATKLPYNPFKMEEDPDAEDGRAVKITAIPTPPELLDRVNGKPYLSGVLTTRTKPSGNKRYGYVEIRAKVPDMKGLLSTFYLFQPNGNQYEIDILEHVGGVSSGTTQNYHYRDGFRYADTDNKGVPHASPTMKLEPDLDMSVYHTYSVSWEPELVVWYVDGIEVRRISGPRISNQPMDIVAQLVVGSRWIGMPDDGSFPVSYDIDYIRHWQK